MSSDAVTVVMITKDRREEALRSVGALVRRADSAPVVVVDNGSSDGTADAVRDRFPEVRVVAAGANLGAAGRNVGVDLASTPYVAFCDDDSGWAPGAFERAAVVLDSHPTVAVLAARMVVETTGRPDPVCAEMAASPLGTGDGLPGPSVMGFVACGAVVRRSAFLEAGGFHPRFGVGGEEDLLALDVAAAGWDLVYVDELEAYHAPSAFRAPASRRASVVRNDLWVSWLRRPAGGALRRSAQVFARVVADPRSATGVVAALMGLPWVLRERRVVPAWAEATVRSLGR